MLAGFDGGFKVFGMQVDGRRDHDSVDVAGEHFPEIRVALGVGGARFAPWLSRSVPDDVADRDHFHARVLGDWRASICPAIAGADHSDFYRAVLRAAADGLKRD